MDIEFLKQNKKSIKNINLKKWELTERLGKRSNMEDIKQYFKNKVNSSEQL